MDSSDSTLSAYGKVYTITVQRFSIYARVDNLINAAERNLSKHVAFEYR